MLYRQLKDQQVTLPTIFISGTNSPLTKPLTCWRHFLTSVLSWLSILDRIYKLTSLDYFWTKVIVCGNLVPAKNSDKFIRKLILNIIIII